MISRSSRFILCVSVLACLSVAVVYGAPPALAQTQSSASNDNADDRSLPAAPSLSADRIIRIIRERPELMTMARSEVALRDPAQAAGMNETTVTQKLRTDPTLRARVTQFLIERGYVDEEDPELLRSAALTRGSQQPEDSASDQVSARNSTPSDRSSDNSSDSDISDERYGTAPSPTYRLPNIRDSAPQRGRSTASEDSSRDRRKDKSPESSEVPKLRRTVPPYEGIPALRDLYTQTIEDRTRLKRFGTELFESARFLQTSPDVPAGSDYVIGAGDGLRVELWGSISRRYTATVDREGRVAIPDVGTVMVSGKTLGATRELVDRALSREYRNINSDVSLTRIRSVRIYVVGDVKHPGSYEISALSTALNALYTAGGPTANGSLREIKHLRNDKVIAQIDAYDLLLHGIRGDAARLEPGDTILVPPVHNQVTVAGAVSRPAIYELKDEKSLAEVLKLAGGLLVSASYRDLRVERVQAHQQRSLLPVPLPDTSDAKALEESLSTFGVQDGDRITIGSIAAFSNASVYLDGHVLHPGKYSYRDGMKLTDLVASFVDLMPEPADHAEIVRLEPPDWKPRVIDLNLRSALTEHQNVELKPFDTVRIYSRYEFDPPKVSINGEVLRPGEYPMSDGMSAADLLRMAGGFRRSAFTDTADLTSYSVETGKRVELDTREVAIRRAIRGEPDTDVRLKPGDVLTIRQMPGWGDIGAAIAISGEVQYPGTYGIGQGERLSSVLRRAGGFREAAYPRGAVLKREQVREMDGKAREALIRRIEGSNPNIRSASADTAALTNAFVQQQQQMIKRLREEQLPGRQVIHISTDISTWANTDADVEVRPGDELIVPKRPTFVAVQGQVNNPSAITYTPGKNAGWYLRRAGGTTEFANSKSSFIVRTDGSVVGNGEGFWGGGVMATTLQPGDTLVVPEKIITDNPTWRNIVNAAQIMSSVAIAAKLATGF